MHTLTRDERLRWASQNSSGERWLEEHRADGTRIGVHASVDSIGWHADEEKASGHETGAHGRRAAERALVWRGVITQADADALIAADLATFHSTWEPPDRIAERKSDLCKALGLTWLDFLDVQMREAMRGRAFTVVGDPLADTDENQTATGHTHEDK